MRPVELRKSPGTIMCIPYKGYSVIRAPGPRSTIHDPVPKMVSWWAICLDHDPSPIQSGRPVHEPVLTIPGTLTAGGPLVAMCLLPGPRPGAAFTRQKKRPGGRLNGRKVNLFNARRFPVLKISGKWPNTLMHLNWVLLHYCNPTNFRKHPCALLSKYCLH